mmetsp:Transcript_91388/g.191045  ORF Transcript_91388/g.191045 Transcript_91388/m.191045 type:complete len:234 (+) Transcript_91388:356-1057(+)
MNFADNATGTLKNVGCRLPQYSSFHSSFYRCLDITLPRCRHAHLSHEVVCHSFRLFLYLVSIRVAAVLPKVETDGLRGCDGLRILMHRGCLVVVALAVEGVDAIQMYEPSSSSYVASLPLGVLDVFSIPLLHCCLHPLDLGSISSTLLLLSLLSLSYLGEEEIYLLRDVLPHLPQLRLVEHLQGLFVAFCELLELLLGLYDLALPHGLRILSDQLPHHQIFFKNISRGLVFMS